MVLTVDFGVAVGPLGHGCVLPLALDREGKAIGSLSTSHH